MRTTVRLYRNLFQVPTYGLLFMYEGRSKRTVKYRKNEDMWAYVASGKRLPGLYLHFNRYVLVSDVAYSLFIVCSAMVSMADAH